jgi:hypothetical protein
VIEPDVGAGAHVCVVCACTCARPRGWQPGGQCDRLVHALTGVLPRARDMQVCSGSETALPKRGQPVLGLQHHVQHPHTTYGKRYCLIWVCGVTVACFGVFGVFL